MGVYARRHTAAHVPPPDPRPNGHLVPDGEALSAERYPHRGLEPDISPSAGSVHRIASKRELRRRCQSRRERSVSAPVSVYVSAEVSAVADLYGELVGPGSWIRPAREQIRLQGARLALGHRLRAPGALVELSNWHPDLAGSDDVAVWSAVLSENDFLGTVARQHGYRALEDVNSSADGRPDPDFERAVEAVLAGDTDELGRLLSTRPDLVGQRSHWPHRATLLHYTAANGVETHRQRVPLNIATVITTLAARGADVNAVAGMYGGGQTPLHLLMTSAHPAAAGVAADARVALVTAGALESFTP